MNKQKNRRKRRFFLYHDLVVGVVVEITLDIDDGGALVAGAGGQVAQGADQVGQAARNPNTLYEYVVERTKDKRKKFYVFIDEIQLSYKVKNSDIDESTIAEEDRELVYTTFYDVLNDLRMQQNLDVYVTGSNSKMLSKDIVTHFRDRGCEIKVYPLSFKGV